MTGRIVDLVQGTAEWHEHRRRYRNASETPAVLGLSPWVSPYMLWEIRSGKRKEESNYAMKRGSSLEPAARAAYEALTGNVMEPVVMVQGDYSASLDGITLDGGRILEVKCPVKGKQSNTWKLAAEGQVPDHYRWQIEHQLIVSGAEACDFWVFDEAGEGVLVEVCQSDGAAERIHEAWEGFLELVREGTPPAIGPLDTVTRDDLAWKEAAESYLVSKKAVEAATATLEAARGALVGLATHSGQEGCGVVVSRYLKAGREEFRVSASKGG